MRPDPVLAGVYDPLLRLDPRVMAERLRTGLGRFGTVAVQRAGAFTIAAAMPDGGPPADDVVGGICQIDGYLEGAPTAPAALIFERWRAGGLAGLGDLRGAFAAALWDEGRQRGCLVRDQLGQRPLFMLESGPVLFFASEVRPLLALPPRRPTPDPAGIARYLSPSPMRETTVPYSGIRRVPAAHAIRLEDGRWSVERYWSLRFREPLSGSPAEHADAIRRQISAAIRGTVGPASDVGVLLSGGLDSSTVAALAASELGARSGSLHAYSQTFPDLPTADESEQIAAVADHVGLDLTRMDVHSGSSLASSLEYLDLYEVPEISATGFFWRPLARRAAADGVEVLLSGEGGDELFAAPLHLIADRLRRGRLFAARTLVARFPNIAYNPWRSLRLRLLWEYGVMPILPPAIHTRFAERKARHEQRRYMSAHGRALLGPIEARPWADLDGPAWWTAKANHYVRTLWQLGAAEQSTRSARLAAVTERHPLLTLDMVEFALRLPPEQAFDPERTRPDLRRAMEGIVPDAVRLRPEKVDFDGVRGYSLLGDIAVIRDLLQDSDARIRPYIKPEVVKQILDTTPKRWGVLSAWGGEVMRLVTIECWLRQQEDPAFARTLLESGRLPAPVLTVQ